MQQLQVKKIAKRDSIKESIFFTPKVISGGIAICGKIGSGKTLAMFSLAQKYHDYRGYKIFDLWGGRRNQGENLYWIIPSPYKLYWALIKKKLRLTQEGAKQYRANLLFPFSYKMPNDLPYLENYVFSKPFTIPIIDIEIEDFKMAVNNLSDDSQTLWDSIKREIKKKDGVAELIKLFEKHKGLNSSIYKNFFIPLIDTGLLASSDAETNIDIKKEAKNRDIISILVLHYIPDKFKFFIINYFLRRIKELSDDGEIGTRIMALIREAYEFFRATERSVAENRMKEFRIKLTFYMQYARGKIHPVLDVQSPCLDEDTKVITYNNQQFKTSKIKDLPKNFKVPSYNFEQSKFEIKNGAKIFVGEKDCYEIELENGEKIIATLEHRFFDKNLKEVFVRNLSIGDEIAYPKREFVNFKTSN